MPISSLVDFILYIIPGFISLKIYNNEFPAKSKKQFEHITQSIINSLLIVTFIRHLDKHCINFWFESNTPGLPSLKYLVSLFSFAFIFGWLQVGSRYFMSYLYGKFPKLRFLQPDSIKIWAKVNDSSTTDWAIVYLKSGAIYSGYIKKYSFDPDSANHDFLLGDVSRIDEDLNEIYTVTGIGVYLNTNEVERIEFEAGVPKSDDAT